VEETLTQTRVDYALFDSNRRVRVIIEAKALGENLSQQNIIMNLVTYAFTYGLQDIFLTDGLLWQHFTDFQPSKVSPNKIIDLAKDNLVECAAYLVHRLDAAKFWPETQTVDALAQRVVKLESIVSSIQQEVALLKTEHKKAVLSMPDNNVERKLTSQDDSALGSYSYIALDEVPDLTKTKPISMRLPDGAEIPVQKWKEVLLEACKFTLQNNTSLPIPLRDRSGRTVRLLSTSEPKQGTSFAETRYNGKTIYIYTNYSANRSVSNADYILSYVPEEKKRCKAGVAFKHIS
jgi:hypothetical protein